MSLNEGSEAPDEKPENTKSNESKPKEKKKLPKIDRTINQTVKKVTVSKAYGGRKQNNHRKPRSPDNQDENLCTLS